MEELDVKFLEVPSRNLVFIRKMVQEYEFAIPVKQYVIGSKDFNPGLCLKTGIRGSYSDLSSVYAKQLEYSGK